MNNKDNQSPLGHPIPCKYMQMMTAFSNHRNLEAGKIASYLQYYCKDFISAKEMEDVEHVIKRTYDLLERVFKVSYHTTKDEYGQEHSGARRIEVHTHQQAHDQVLYELEKHYPHGEVTISEVEED